MRKLVLLFPLLLSGCVGPRTVTGEIDLAAFLKRGEAVTVYCRDGRIQTILFGKVFEDQLVGSRDFPPYKLVSIPLVEINGVRVERIQAGRTTLAVMAGLIIFPPFLALEILEDDCC